jgi:hypothetical protein
MTNMTPTNDNPQVTDGRTDEEVLKDVINLLETRVEINTGFIPDGESGNLTHQVLQIVCGEYVTVSAPQPLEFPLRLATAEEQGFSVN